MTRPDRRRFPAIAALALAGAVLGLLFSPVQAQAGSAPAKPTGLSATASHDRVVLTWDDPDDDTITGYVILRRVRENDVGGEFSELVPDTGTAATTYTDDTVAAGTTYTYRIKAINEHGVSERSLWFHIDTPAAPERPDKPTGLSATASHDQVVLTWDDPDDDTITGYVILRRVRENDVGGEFSELVPDTGTAATTYTDDTVAAGTTYTYRIKAINEHGVSERSLWFHIDTPAAPERPDKPTGLSATASHDQVVLTWDDPDDDTITGYVILRRVRENDVGGEFSVLVADTGTAATTYTDDTVVAETTYTYRIKAINEHGVSERSLWFHIDTPAAPQATVVEGGDPDEQDGEDDPGGAPGRATLGGPGGRANVSEPDGNDCPISSPTQCRVAVGGSATGNIATNGDIDAFEVELEVGHKYQIDVEGAATNQGTLVDPLFLYVAEIYEGSFGQISGSGNDNNGVGRNARKIFTLPEGNNTGTYWLLVGEKGSDATGIYRLSVIVLGANGASEADTDFPKNTTTPGRVEVGASATGNIGAPRDYDWFRVDLQAGHKYQFDLEGSDTDRGTLGDPWLKLLNRYGNNLRIDDNSGTGDNAQIVYTAIAARTYYLEASEGADNLTGTYTLSVRDVTGKEGPTVIGVPTDVPPGGLGPSEVPGPVRNVAVPGTSRLRVVYWDAPDETETGAQWITKFRIYASTGAGCDGWKAAEYEVEHPGFTTPPQHPTSTDLKYFYFKIVEVASDTDDVTIQFGVSAVNDLGEGPCVGEPAPSASKLVVADGPPGLVPNAPNPFNANTLIPYRLDADGPVRLEIYNLLGQSMRTLVDEVQAAGTYWVRWDARDGRGAAVAAGVYLVRLHYPGGVQTQRMLYLK